MKKQLLSAAILLAFLSIPAISRGAIIVFDDKVDFMTATGATIAANVSAASPVYGSNSPVPIGNLTFSNPAQQKLWVGAWTSKLPGNDLAINDKENLDVAINTPAVAYSFGFDFVEPKLETTINGPFVDSTFAVSLYLGSTLVDSFTFERPNDQATFVGVWTTSDAGFDNVKIRETVGGIGNEFFGNFYVGARPIPEPWSVAVWGLLGVLGLGAARWRKRAA